MSVDFDISLRPAAMHTNTHTHLLAGAEVLINPLAGPRRANVADFWRISQINNAPAEALIMCEFINKLQFHASVQPMHAFAALLFFGAAGDP